MGWNELEIHRWLEQSPRPAVLDGSTGHDAAVLKVLAGRPVWCTDQVVEGVHLTERETPRWIGTKVVGRALSDLAACGATPMAILLTLALPEHWSSRQVKSAIGRARDRAEQDGAALVGGDLTSTVGPALASASALGVLPGRRRAVGRDRARVGQAVLLTGAVGGSLLGRHRDPRARLEAGRQLVGGGATAMIDVSDGLGLDLTRLARASGVALDVELDAIPLHAQAARMARRSGRSALLHGLTDGEDHELIACLPVRSAERLIEQGLAECPRARIIGRVRRGSRVRWLDPDGEEVAAPSELGWVHGAPAHGARKSGSAGGRRRLGE